MANKNEAATNANPTTKKSTTNAKFPLIDPRDYIQYTIDKTLML